MNIDLFMTDAHSVTCNIYNVDYDKSFKTRKREFVQARQITMSIAYKILRNNNVSLSKVGNFFGKDHATVLHAQRTCSNLNDTDQEYKKLYNDIYLGIENIYRHKYKMKIKIISKIDRKNMINDLKKIIYRKIDINDIIKVNDLLSKIL